MILSLGLIGTFLLNNFLRNNYNSRKSELEDSIENLINKKVSLGNYSGIRFLGFSLGYSKIVDKRLPNISQQRSNLKNENFTILDAIESLKLVNSRSEIKRLIKSDGIKVNDQLYKKSDLSLNDFSDLNEIKITVGKKKVGILKIL